MNVTQIAVPFLWALLWVLAANPLLAQEQSLSDRQLKLFRERMVQRISEFQDNLGMIASVEQDRESKNTYIEQTRDMFINRATDSFIEISSLNSEEVATLLIPAYLSRLSRLTAYSRVEVKAAEIAYVSGFVPAGRDEYNNVFYEATATIKQEFIGYGNDGMVIYRDVTTKTIGLTLKQQQVFLAEADETAGEGGPKWQWVALLNDIKVAGTIPPE